MRRRETDGRALLAAGFLLVGGIIITGDTLDGVGRASGFALVIEWAKVVLGPGLLVTGVWEMLQLYRQRPQSHEDDVQE